MEKEIELLNQDKESESFLEKNKYEHSLFSFYIENENFNPMKYVHEFLGVPKLPLLGKYSRDSYDMSEISSLIAYEYFLDSQKENDIQIPVEILDYLKNLNFEEIENNTSLGEIPKISINNFESIKFYWCVINNKFKKTNSNGIEVYNIVPHTFLFPNLDFSKNKRITKFHLICLFTDKENQNSGLEEFTSESIDKSNKYSRNINFNNLRMEYSSTHVVKGSLGFSPNNLEFKMNTNNNIVDFYLILIDKEIHIFYYWIINSEDTQDLLRSIFKESKNLNDLINNLKIHLEKANNIPLEKIIKLFKYKN
jgi:hypothetical protein